MTQEALEQLFGTGHQLRVHRPLYQEGHFAAEETVTIIGPRQRMISNLRILGPCRSYTQVELAYSDGIALGFDLPHRLSGKVQGTIGAMLMGPAGFYEMQEGVIRAMRHVHMGPDDAAHYGVKAGDMMKLKIGGPRRDHARQRAGPDRTDLETRGPYRHRRRQCLQPSA